MSTALRAHNVYTVVNSSQIPNNPSQVLQRMYPTAAECTAFTNITDVFEWLEMDPLRGAVCSRGIQEQFAKLGVHPGGALCGGGENPVGQRQRS